MDIIEKVLNKKRLIDANSLDERFDKRIKWLRLDMHDQYSLGLYHGAVTDKDLIGEMPIVDAVEVVRCKDCKHYKEFRTKRNKQIMRLCYRMGKNDMEYSVKPDDFCSYGERKGGDE